LQHSVFVLVSRYEPWGVALAEAQYAGMPVICSEAVGASVELVRHHTNGLLVPTEDAAAIAQAMAWMESHPDRLAEMGATGKALAAPFAATYWAQRWKSKFEEIVGTS
jgi:glycosyltransferase involved in cell wall biosynthesis